MNLSFGQPIGSIIQMAYTVENMDFAINKWIKGLGVGPWFLLEGFKGEDAMYRSQESQATINIAMAFSGHVLIELIQPMDDHPSVYKETINSKGFGFHHFGVASDDFNEDKEKMLQLGCELAFMAKVPTGGSVAYFDAHEHLPGFVELIEASPTMDEAFGKFYRASIDWDGSEPVRPFV
ncbi:VOC family protein [Halomonas sp. WWR20]